MRVSDFFIHTTLRHVVLFAFKDSATVEQIDAIVTDFGTFKDRIPGITAYESGTNLSPEGLNPGFTHSFKRSFASEEERNVYLLHAAHQAFVDTLGNKSAWHCVSSCNISIWKC